MIPASEHEHGIRIPTRQWSEERGLPAYLEVDIENRNDRFHSAHDQQEADKLREQYVEFYLERQQQLEDKIKQAHAGLAMLEGLETLLQEDSDRVLRKDHVKCENYLEEVQLLSTEVESLCTPIIRIDSEEVEGQEQERAINGVTAARERFSL